MFTVSVLGSVLGWPVFTVAEVSRPLCVACGSGRCGQVSPSPSGEPQAQPRGAGAKARLSRADGLGSVPVWVVWASVPSTVCLLRGE